MRFLIVSFGSIGRRHFRNLQTLGETDIILLRSNKSTLDTEEIAQFVVETNLDKALAHRPDVVLLTNPTALHLDVAIPAARLGCHLFFEKPIAESMERIPELLDALKVGGGKAFTAFQFRFHPGLRKIKNLINDGSIGQVISARAHWGEYVPGWHPWEDYKTSYSTREDLGGGVIRTLSHPLDYMRWLFGEVKYLSSFYLPVSALDVPTEAIAEIGMQFENDIVGSVHVNYIERPGQHTLEIIGDGGTIRWDNADGAVDLYSVERAEWQRFELPVGFERNDLFLAEMRNFLEFIQENKPAACTLDDGIQTQRLIEAAFLSGRNKEQICLSEKEN
ncbi:MAG: hypothetical protein CL609_09425 [Anaerolineaceae bacterium]|nr:hypothetical protein [Anaerolineaceae bacterium]